MLQEPLTRAHLDDAVDSLVQVLGEGKAGDPELVGTNAANDGSMLSIVEDAGRG